MGIGTTPILWPLNAHNQKYVQNLVTLDPETKTFEHAGDRTADHRSFMLEGFMNAVTFTLFADGDSAVIAKELQSPPTANPFELLLQKTTAFQHYHLPSDTPDTIQIKSLKLTKKWLLKAMKKTGAIK